MTDIVEHRYKVSAPPDDDGSASWRCSCGERGSVSAYDAEMVALREAAAHANGHGGGPVKDNKERTAVLVVSVKLSAPTTEEAENRAAATIVHAFESDYVAGQCFRVASHIGDRVIYPHPTPVSAEEKVEEARRLLRRGNSAGALEILSRK